MTRTSHSVIDLPRFIQATRDSGYKGTSSAVAELVDNSIQAGASQVVVTIARPVEDLESPPTIHVVDNGSGMAGGVLREALRFGGSTRFGARHGLGRFGMGLPNASLSQSTRVEVVSWTGPRSASYSYLDVDEIAAGLMSEVPAPKRTAIPDLGRALGFQSGTLVSWVACDRLEFSRVSTIERKLHAALGRVFRHFIWDGVQIVINGARVAGLDPLYLHHDSPLVGACQFGEALEYEVRTGPKSPNTGVVRVQFSELPIEEWAELPTAEKRRRGISNGAGVSVVRAGREIDYGWFFMGGKRRENYDDWWRCEVRFDPELDEAFGITHTKQEIRPQDHLLEAVSGELEEIAKALNSRARQRYARFKSAAASAPIEFELQRQDSSLPSLPGRKASSADGPLLRTLEAKDNVFRENGHHRDPSPQYRIVEEEQPDSAFFRTVVDRNRVIVVINTVHAFYRRYYRRLAKGEALEAGEALGILQALLLGAARAEAMTTRKAEHETLNAFREHWGQVLRLLIDA